MVNTKRDLPRNRTVSAPILLRNYTKLYNGGEVARRSHFPPNLVPGRYDLAA